MEERICNKSVPMVSPVEQSIKDMDMGLHSSCSTLYATTLQENKVFLPHVDQILCKRHCIRIACDCNGSVCATTFTFFTVWDANHSPTNLPGPKREVSLLILGLSDAFKTYYCNVQRD